GLRSDHFIRFHCSVSGGAGREMALVDDCRLRALSSVRHLQTVSYQQAAGLAWRAWGDDGRRARRRLCRRGFIIAVDAYLTVPRATVGQTSVCLSHCRAVTINYAQRLCSTLKS